MELINGSFPTIDGPLTNITPFTYRDGDTYLEILESLRDWIKDYLVPSVNVALSAIVDGVNEHNAELVVQINAELDSINASISEINAKIDNTESGEA